jgi:3-phosphoshikimate 1-carboxyvinyltransferase
MKVTLGSPSHPLKGTIDLPGSKSISNRLLVMNHIYKGHTKPLNLSAAEDTVLMARAIKKIEHGEREINIGDAGADMRFLTAVLAITPGEWVLSGSERMSRRPIEPLVEALVSLGADITYAARPGFAPLLIRGRQLEKGEVTIDASVSSQFISALLMIAPVLKNGLHIHLSGSPVSAGYTQMTLSLMKAFGVSIKVADRQITVLPSLPALPETFQVEGDWSSASYYYSLCAIYKNSEIRINHLNKASLQPDSRLPAIYRDLGVSTTYGEDHIIIRSVTGGSPEPLKLDLSGQPDIAQTIAVTCFALNRPVTLMGLSTLQWKETARLTALETELRKLGADVSTTADALTLAPVTHRLKAGSVSTYNDHRMAMSFAPLAGLYENVIIEDGEVVAKSYPAFWEHLKALGFRVNLQPVNYRP